MCKNYDTTYNIRSVDLQEIFIIFSPARKRQNDTAPRKKIRIRIRQNDSNPDQANETNAITKKGLQSGSGQKLPIWIQNFNTVLILPYMYNYVSTQHRRIFQRFTRLEKGS
jgi:hypothetical protein